MKDHIARLVIRSGDKDRNPPPVAHLPAPAGFNGEPGFGAGGCAQTQEEGEDENKKPRC